MSDKVLVTGATGHLGSALVRALLASGRPVRAFVHERKDQLDGLDVERVTGDVRDPAAVRAAVAGCGVVHHLAALVRLQKWDHGVMEEVNVEGVRNVTGAVRAEGSRLVHYSSIHAFRPDRTENPVDESREYASHPSVPAYDRTKARGSRVVDEAVRAGLDAVTLHPTGVLGPYDFGTSNQGRWLRRAAIGREPILVRGGFDWVDVRDVVAAGLAAEAPGRATAGEHFIIGGRRAEAREIATLAAAVLGRKPPPFMLPLGFVRAVVPAVDLVTGVLRIRTPFTHAALHALDTHRIVSHEKASRVLGHQPRPLEDTVRDMMEWYRERGMLG
jgi:dihydroflavonol-4-reductase